MCFSPFVREKFMELLGIVPHQSSHDVGEILLRVDLAGSARLDKRKRIAVAFPPSSLPKKSQLFSQDLGSNSSFYNVVAEVGFCILGVVF